VKIETLRFFRRHDSSVKLWGYLKNRVYRTQPRTLDELKQNLRRNSWYPSWDVAAGNGEPQRQIERMHTYRKTPSTGRNFQTL